MSFQRYQVLELVDTGGMAEVFRASATSSDGVERIVAIKRVLPGLSRNRKFMAMFVDEARLAMHLDHPNIVRVFDLGMADGTYFLVMEYVDGINLKQLIDAQEGQPPHIDPALCAHVVAAVCDGLAHAHEKHDLQGQPLGIVHRDVSPPNILVSRQGTVKLADFGLAKAHSQVERTDPGVLKGKFAYLCPEATRGESVDHRADLFCLGIVFWELLAGRRLFRGASDIETLEKVKRCSIPALSTVRGDVDPELEGLLRRALAKEPADRWDCARSMSAALRAYLRSTDSEQSQMAVAALARSLDEGGSDASAPVPPKDAASAVEEAVQHELERLQPLGSEGEFSAREPGSVPLTSDGSGHIVAGEARPLRGLPQVRSAPGLESPVDQAASASSLGKSRSLSLGWVIALILIAMGVASSLTVYVLRAWTPSW